MSRRRTARTAVRAAPEAPFLLARAPPPPARAPAADTHRGCVPRSSQPHFTPGSRWSGCLQTTTPPKNTQTFCCLAPMAAGQRSAHCCAQASLVTAPRQPLLLSHCHYLLSIFLLSHATWTCRGLLHERQGRRLGHGLPGGARAERAPPPRARPPAHPKFSREASQHRSATLPSAQTVPPSHAIAPLPPVPRGLRTGRV